MVFQLWLYEWKRVFQSPALLLFACGLPITLLIVVGFVVYDSFEEEMEAVEILIVDEDQTFETNMLVQQLESDRTLSDHIVFEHGEQPLSQYMEDPGDSAAIVRIPEGFTDKLRAGENEKIHVYLNNSVPFSSQLAQILLESGQSYITAAQTGVNTVHHFHSRHLDGDERREALQQSTLHFTFLALSRNDLFTMEEDLDGEALALSDQVFVTVIVLLYLMTFFLFSLLYEPKESRVIQERLALIQVTFTKQQFARFLHQFSFSILYGIGLLAVLSLYIEFRWEFVVQWIIVFFWICILSFLLDKFFRQSGLKWFAFLLVSLSLLTVSGFIIPPAYLPESLKSDFLIPVRGLYTGFREIMVQGNMPLTLWIGLITAGVLTILLATYLPGRKVGR